MEKSQKSRIFDVCTPECSSMVEQIEEGGGGRKGTDARQTDNFNMKLILGQPQDY
jgi:hypothetical protein